MTAFFDIDRSDLIYALVVVVSVFVLRFLTNTIFKWLQRQKQKKSPDLKSNSLYWVKRILNTLWVVFGLILLSFLFVNEKNFHLLRENFKYIFYFAIVIIATIVLADSVNKWFQIRIIKKIENKEDSTSYKFLRYVAIIGLYFIGIFFALLVFPSLKGIAQTALGGAGIIALVAGIASREAFANIVGGLFIISFKPFRIGDSIKIADNISGTVTDITLRHTLIRDSGNNMIVIPNAVINTEKIFNYDLSDSKVCEFIEFRISFESDLELAKKIMEEACEKHPLCIDNRSQSDISGGTPRIITALISINDYSMTIRAWAWAMNNSDAFEMHCDLLETIKNRFENEGIILPYPSQTLVFKDKNDSHYTN